VGLCLQAGRHRSNDGRLDVSAARPMRAYVAVTASYWAFMLSDGALRMLVLLHFNGLGFTPIQLAWLFLLYEVAGIVTNLYAGWLAARFGLASTLYAGLTLQILALVVLTQLDPAWGVAASVAFVMAVQGVSGVAKDLSKMSSKSAVKLLAPQGDGTLFRWVALLTGSKNAVKGLGFFLGAALLALAGFEAAIWAMAAILLVILVAVALFLPPGLPAKDRNAKFGAWRSSDPRVNRRLRVCSCLPRAMSGSWSASRSISRPCCPMGPTKADAGPSL
jgi:MFS family permease